MIKPVHRVMLPFMNRIIMLTLIFSSFSLQINDDSFVFADEAQSTKNKVHSIFFTIDPGDSKQNIIDRDDRYVMYATGVVLDTQTQLEWFAGPDDSTDWIYAKKWVSRLKAAGGGWRMPTLEELETLHQTGVGNRNITSLLKTTGFWLWSGKSKAPIWAWGLVLPHGVRDWLPQDYHTHGRVFAVRSS